MGRHTAMDEQLRLQTNTRKNTQHLTEVFITNILTIAMSKPAQKEIRGKQLLQSVPKTVEEAKAFRDAITQITGIDYYNFKTGYNLIRKSDFHFLWENGDFVLEEFYDGSGITTLYQSIGKRNLPS